MITAILILSIANIVLQLVAVYELPHQQLRAHLDGNGKEDAA